MEGNKNSVHTRRLYRFYQLVIFLFYKLFFRLSVRGVTNVPLTGTVIIASNHASFLDPPLLGGVIPREASFFAKKEICSVPFIRHFIHISKSIPVDRHGYNANAFREMMRLLKEGRAVVIFPEGTRTKTGEFLTPKTGAGMAAVMADAPVVPCWIEGSFKAKPFVSKITVHFLPPFHPGEIEASTKKDHYFLVSQKIMCDINNLYKKHMAMLNQAKSK